jgi:hypothetical protein
MDGATRVERVLSSFRDNYAQVAIDVIVVLSWMIVTAEMFRVLSVLRWVEYAVLFVGVVVYARLTPGWDMPDQN